MGKCIDDDTITYCILRMRVSDGDGRECEWDEDYEGEDVNGCTNQPQAFRSKHMLYN